MDKWTDNETEPKTRIKPPDSLRQEASQAAGAAPTLRYGPAGDSAPRLRLKASSMAERFLSALRPYNKNDNILYRTVRLATRPRRATARTLPFPS